MARPALTAEAIEDFREALCAVAMRQFAQEGYGAVTLRGITRELGKSHALAYRYFESKEAIFAAVRVRCLERFAVYQEKRLGPIADPERAIREGAQSYLDFAIEEPHAFRVMFDLEQPPPADDPALKSAHRRAFRVLEVVVERAIAAGVVCGRASEITRVLWASVHGVAALHIAGQLSPRTAHSLSAATVDVLLKGFALERRRRA